MEPKTRSVKLGNKWWPTVAASLVVGAAGVWFGYRVGLRRRPRPHLLEASENPR